MTPPDRDRQSALELSVWREACRHIHIEDSLARIARVMARSLPVAVVALRRFDRERSRLVTAAIIDLETGDAPSEGSSELTPEEASLVIRVLRGGQVVLANPALLMLPPGRETLLGPLIDAEGREALLILSARSGEVFGDAARAAVQSLIEPFAVALANDGRLHELAQLREAAEADNRSLRSRLVAAAPMEPIVGIAGGLSEVMESVTQVAGTDAPVLILGETGSGKEVIARAIHERSRRSQGPVVRVNCGAIPSELVDSELFGHERGGFTGAVATRKGWFERADGGTLFLDEIGELPLAAQVRLLRVLQDGTIERVGGNRTLYVDVRVVAATHRDLEAMTRDGRFRRDLWYRISVFPVRLPSLRQRLQDLPELVAYFARRAGERLGNPDLVATAEDLQMLRGYAWPGNIRELSSVIERACILGRGRRLEIAAALGTGGTTHAPELLPPGELAVRLDDAMATHIERALIASAGRIEGPRGAAAILNINPHTLRARMRKLGIDWSRFRRRRRRLRSPAPT